MSTNTPRPNRKAIRFDSLEQEVFLGLWRTYDRLRMLEDELFHKYELTPQQYNAMRILRSEYPGALPTLTLANRLVSRAPDITRMLDKLEKRSLIERNRVPENRRLVMVRLTDKGTELLDELADPLRDCHSRQLGHLGAAELRQLSSLLKQARLPFEVDDSHWRS